MLNELLHMREPAMLSLLGTIPTALSGLLALSVGLVVLRIQMTQSAGEMYAERVHAAGLPPPAGYISWVQSLSQSPDMVVQFYEGVMRPEVRATLGSVWAAVLEGGVGLASSQNSARRLLFWFYILGAVAVAFIVLPVIGLCFIDWDLRHPVGVCVTSISGLGLTVALFVAVVLIAIKPRPSRRFRTVLAGLARAPSEVPS